MLTPLELQALRPVWLNFSEEDHFWFLVIGDRDEYYIIGKN